MRDEGSIGHNNSCVNSQNTKNSQNNLFLLVTTKFSSSRASNEEQANKNRDEDMFMLVSLIDPFTGGLINEYKHRIEDVPAKYDKPISCLLPRTSYLVLST